MLSWTHHPDIWHNLEASFTVLGECDDFVTASFRDRADNLKRRLGAKISQLSELVSSALDFKSRNRDIFRFNVHEMVRCFQWMKEFVFCRTPIITNERENAFSVFSRIASTFPEWIHVEELISKGFDNFIFQFSRCGQYIQQSLLDLSAIDMTDGQRRCVLENIEKVLSSYSNLTPLFELIAAFFADQRAALYNSDLANSFQNIPSLDSMRTRIETVVYEWSQEMEQDLLCNTEVVASSLSSVRDAFFKKFGRIYRLLVESKIPLAKYGLNQAGQGYSVHIKSQLTAISSKATAMIPAFPQEDSEFLVFNNLCDMLRSFKDNFQGAQLQGFAKNLFDEIEKLLKKHISEVLQIVDAELVNDVADISYEDVVDTLIDVKSMALVLFLFQEAIDRKIDVSLSRCKNSIDGNKKIGMLSVELNRRESTDSKGSDGLAQRIIAEHQAFKGFALSLRNTKTVNFTIIEVLEGLQLEAALADEIRTAYRQFEADYWKLVESGLGNIDFKCQELVAEVSNFSPRSSCPLIRRVLFYVVRIFAFWTLSNASDFLEAVVEDGDEEDMHRTARCPLKVDLLMKKVRQILASSNDHESLLLNESRASNADVKLSLILHPDKLTSPDRPLSEEDKDLCSAAYLKVKEAYEILISRRKVSADEVRAEDILEDKKKQSRSFILQPHAAQVVSVLLYFTGASNQRNASDFKFSNQFIQIGTGEGKSITLAVTSCVLALLGFDVDCACYSQYLSSRDHEAFANIFNSFGLSQHVTYGTYDSLAESLVNSGFDSDGIRGAVKEYILPTVKVDNSSRIISSLLDNVSAAASYIVGAVSRKEVRPRILLIDEVDIFFSVDFYGASYNPGAYIKHPVIFELLRYLYEKRTLSGTVLYREALASVEYKRYVGSFPRCPDLMHEALKRMVDDLQDFERREYKVVMGRIGYVQHDCVSFSTSYGYKKAFAYLKEHFRGSINKVVLEQNLQLSIRCGRFSFGEVPKLYHSIMGVSGTLASLSESEQSLLRNDVRIEKMVYMPSVFGPNQLQFAGNSNNGVKIVSEQSVFFMEVVNEIKTRLVGLGRNTTKRAVLVFFRSIAALTAFMASEEYGRSGLKDQVHIITEETAFEEKAALIRHAASSNAVTLLTRAFGRGTDFVCYDEKLQAAGGVHVLTTFLSEQVSEETQLKGRTARQGNQGSFSMVLLASELKRDFDISAAEVQQMISSGTIYDSLHKKRVELQDRTLPQFLQKIADIKIDHAEAQQFVQDLLNGNETSVMAFLLRKNKCRVSF